MREQNGKAGPSDRGSRQFNWISSVAGNPEDLEALSQKMAWFYREVEGRVHYQEMLDTQENVQVEENSVRNQMPKYVCGLNPGSVLEVGCSSGRLYRQMRSYGYEGDYTGIDVADYVIAQNRQSHPEVRWQCAAAYEIRFGSNSFDVCFSLYVLEHLVYPERALREMLRVTRSGGRLVLVFPDFVASGRLASQKLGLSIKGSASQKLRSGKPLDALVSLYDSRMRLRSALRTAVSKHGPFPVNANPICLAYPANVQPDHDAIYIASKREVHDWALANGCLVEYPCGTDGEFAEQAFVVIIKR